MSAWSHCRWNCELEGPDLPGGGREVTCLSVCACVSACVSACVYVHEHACVRACVSECVRAYVRVCSSAHLYNGGETDSTIALATGEKLTAS